jgi:uncharacterized protein YlzI (FlbEa/FlbD family)
MIKLTGLNGDSILVGAGSIFRLRATAAYEGADANKVEYGGGYIFTHESIETLIDRIGEKGKFVKLTTRSGKPVFINANAVSRIREALAINGPGTEIVVGGQYQHVVEDLETVVRLLSD